MSTTTAPLGKHFNFAQYLIERNLDRAAKTAYIDDQGSLSYGELTERVRRVASALLALGTRREERVLLLMHDCSDWAVGFLGALYAGIVPVAANTLLTADDYAYMLGHSRAQAVIVSHALLPTLQSALEQGGHEVRAIIVARAATSLPAGVLALEDVIPGLEFNQETMAEANFTTIGALMAFIDETTHAAAAA